MKKYEARIRQLTNETRNKYKNLNDKNVLGLRTFKACFEFRYSYFEFFHKQRGQALITLIFFVLIAMSVITSSVIVMVASTTSTSKLESGTSAYYVAESGVENAMLRLLRDPKYCGEVLPVGTGNATIVVTDANNSCNGVSPFTIVVTGVDGRFSRKIQVDVQYTSSGMTITSWKEV